MSRVLPFIGPQLPTLVVEPPEGAEWIHEVKHDGYRTQLVIESGEVRAYTRNGHDWSERYPGVVARAKGLPCRSAILDGEIIVQDKRGASDFEALQSALRERGAPLIFYAFDLLHHDGCDWRNKPLLERRDRLKRLIEPDARSVIQFSEDFAGDGPALFQACAKHQLEGIVSKLATAPYQSGRSRTWLKTKCFTESELILVGIDRDHNTGAARALLAKLERGTLTYAGPAFIALQREDRDAFEAMLDELANDQPIFSWLRNRKAKWVKPELNVKVKHLAGGRWLRHATVRGIA